jgi:hypothetical protein
MRGSNRLRGKNRLIPHLAAAAILVSAPIWAQAASDTAHPSTLHRAHQTVSSTFSRPKPFPIHSFAHQLPHSGFHTAPLTHSFAVEHRTTESHNATRHSVTPHSYSAHTRLASAGPTPRAHLPRTRISAQAPMVVKKTLTTEDFMRAAGAARTSEAIVAPYTPAPQPLRPPSERVEGFGAEAAMLGSPRTPASSAAPAPPNTDDPELAALSHPSHEELAESAIEPRLPNLYSSSGRLIVPAPLVGSHDVLVHQNEMADAEGLIRIENDDQLASLRSKHLLVDFPESASLQLNPALPDNRRCARPWTVRFATDMARAYYARFHQALQVNSAVRTVQYQLHLERVNGNAAGVDGESASPHLTGQAVDFGKRGMSLTQLAWMRGYLKPLMDAGKLDVEEEFKQACFHISVYRGYLPTRKSPPRSEVAEIGANSAQ